jgi:hypothetical protein
MIGRRRARRNIVLSEPMWFMSDDVMAQPYAEERFARRTVGEVRIASTTTLFRRPYETLLELHNVGSLPACKGFNSRSLDY